MKGKIIKINHFNLEQNIDSNYILLKGNEVLVWCISELNLPNEVNDARGSLIARPLNEYLIAKLLIECLKNIFYKSMYYSFKNTQNTLSKHFIWKNLL